MVSKKSLSSHALGRRPARAAIILILVSMIVGAIGIYHNNQADPSAGLTGAIGGAWKYLFLDLWAAIKWLTWHIQAFLSWSLEYLLVGAAVIIPIWIISRVIRATMAKSHIQQREE